EDLVFDPATARNEKVPGTDRRGIAAEVMAKAGDVLLLSSSLTYTRAEFTSSNALFEKGDLLPYIPQLVLRSDVVAKHKLARVLGRDLEGRIGAGIEGLESRPLPYKESGQNVFLVDMAAGLRLKE